MIHIRHYQPLDLPAVCLCMAELQDYEKNLEPRYRERSGQEIAAEYLQYLLQECETNNGSMHVAEQVGEIVGFACEWTKSEDGICVSHLDKFCYVSDIVVLPDQRKQGIGKALLVAVETRAKEKNLPAIVLSALARNESAREAYKKSGFREYEVMLIKEI